MTCSTDKVNGKTPIGVVLQQTIITTTDTEIKYQGIAAALEDLKDSVDRNAANSSYSYSVSGITGWRLPTKEELSAIRNYIGNIDDGFTKAGGTTFKHKNYWTSNNDDGQSWVANPFTGKTDTFYYYGSANVRPVLDLSGLL